MAETSVDEDDDFWENLHTSQTDTANISERSTEDLQVSDNVDESGDIKDVSSEKSVPKKVKFHIDYEKWKTFPIKCNKRGDRSLGGEWSDEISNAISKINPVCPLVFKWNHIRKASSRKRHTHFFTTVARCKFPGCLKYKITVKKEPTGKGPVKAKACLVAPYTEIKHTKGLQKGRPIKGRFRHEIAAEIKEKGPSKLYYEKVGSVTQEAFDAGNTSGFGSKEILRKISSESTVASKLHKDVVAEVVLLKHVYEKEDDRNSTMKGCIRSISVIPFTVTMYTAEQLVLLDEQIRNGTAILYFDATGKVISNIPIQDKRVYYYALLLKGYKQGDPPVPVAEMMSNSHNTTDVTTFFLKLTRDLHQSFPNAGIPQRIEIDYSWAFIHGILLSFNHEDISSYLQRSWDTVNGSQNWGSHTKVHICSAHLLHKVSGKLKALMPGKEIRKYILFVIARMTEAKSLSEIDSTFRDLSILLMSEYRASHPEFERANEDLDGVIAHHSLTEVEHEDVSPFDDDALEEVIGSKPSQSAFAHHFNRIIEDIKSSLVAETQNSTANEYYCPSVVSYLMSTYMSIVPLWTGCLLEGELRHDTNSPAENWMKILKRDILQSKTRLSPANFIIEVRSNLKGRLREYKYKLTQDSSKEGRKAKKRTKKSPATFADSEEKWEKKQKTKSLYFSSPSKVPKPKKRQKKVKTKSFQGETGLHWGGGGGGKVQFGERIVHLSNTCTVDNLLMMMYLLLKRSDIKTWFQEHQHELEVLEVLLEIESLFQSGNWTEGRAVWLRRFLEVPNTDTWDVWGSEADKFVIHFAEVQESESTSVCSKRRCPRKQRSLKSTEIILGDLSDENSEVNLQDSLSEWSEMSPSNCTTGTPHGPCNGIRTCSTRVFLHDPPILIVSVSYLSQRRSLDASGLPSSVIVAERRYDLFGYTLCSSAHFKCYFLKDNHWFKYDGLCVPEVSPAKGRGTDGLLEHVVFVRQLCD